jgi:hypothetical protein
MVGVLLLAALLYLANLNGVSLWEDESWMAIAIRGDLPGVWSFATDKGVHPPLYFLLTWCYARLAGDSEIALRWFGGMWALVGIALTYRLGADWYGRKAGIFAALLAAGSLFLIYFARNARHYTAFFALALILIWAYHHWLRNPESRRWLASLVLLQTALLYTHYFGAWMALVLGLHAGLRVGATRRVVLTDNTLTLRHWLRLVGALVLSGVLFLPWIPSVIQQFSASGSGLGYVLTDTGLALKSYVDRVFNANYPLSLTLLAIGLYATWRLRKFSTGLLLLLWVIPPTALSLLVNARFHWFIERNMIFTLGAVCILFGAGLGWLATWRAGRWVALLAALAFVSLGTVKYEDFYRVIALTANWREAARQVAVDARPTDKFVIRGEPYSMDYYLLRYGIKAEFTPLLDWLQNPVTPERIWLIDADWAVRFEAIEALPPDMVLTHRPVVLPVVSELYQRPPQTIITTFADTFALGSTTSDIALAPGKRLILDLWWQALKPSDFDYSVGVYLVAPDGQVIAQDDGAFDRGRINATALPLDTWTHDARELDLPESLPSGEYMLLVAMYDWRDGRRLKPENGREDDLYLLATMVYP